MTKTIRTAYEEISNFIHYLKVMQYDFEVRTTTNSTIIKFQDIYSSKKMIFNSGGYMSHKEMRLQREIKKEVEENTKGQIIKYNGQKIAYNQFSDTIEYMIETTGEYIKLENIYEMDITKAYYKIALNLGYISQAFYDKCLNLPKDIRLRLIGSIATKKVIEIYKKGEQVSIKVVQNERLRQIWFHICYEVGKIMSECSESIHDYFVFYWVDGIYFQKRVGMNIESDPSRQIIQNIFENNNLEFTITKLDYITLQNYDTYINLECYKDKQKKSNFSVPKTKVRKYYYNNKELVI